MAWMGHTLHTDHILLFYCFTYHSTDIMCCLTNTQDSKARQFWCWYPRFVLVSPLLLPRGWIQYRPQGIGHRFPGLSWLSSFLVKRILKWMTAMAVFEPVYMFVQLLEGKWGCSQQEIRWQADWNTGNANCHNTGTQGTPQEHKLTNQEHNQHWLI